MICSDVKEKWAPVPVAAYARAYEVSTHGRVRCVPRIADSEYFIRRINGGCLKGRVRQNGYKTVTLSVKRQRAKFGVHELVAAAFVPNPSCQTAVTHINGDTLDNRAANLVWGGKDNA